MSARGLRTCSLQGRAHVAHPGLHQRAGGEAGSGIRRVEQHPTGRSEERIPARAERGAAAERRAEQQKRDATLRVGRFHLCGRPGKANSENEKGLCTFGAGGEKEIDHKTNILGLRNIF